MLSHALLVVLLCASATAFPGSSGSGFIVDDSGDDFSGSGSGSGRWIDGLYDGEFSGSGSGSACIVSPWDISILKNEDEDQCLWQAEKTKEISELINFGANLTSSILEQELKNVRVHFLDEPKNFEKTANSYDEFVAYFKEMFTSKGVYWYIPENPEINYRGRTAFGWTMYPVLEGSTTFYFQGHQLTGIDFLITKYEIGIPLPNGSE